MSQPRALQLGARDQQHLVGQVDADRPLDPRRQDLDDPAGAGADVEQVGDPPGAAPGAEQLEQAMLDLDLVDVQRADLVPLGGIALEVVGRPLGAAADHLLQALKIEADGRVVAGQRIDQGAGELRRGAVGGQPEIGPGALAHALDQAGLAEQLQVARDPRLALAEDPGEVGDGEVAVGAERQQPKPGRLARRAERRQQVVHALEIPPFG